MNRSCFVGFLLSVVLLTAVSPPSSVLAATCLSTGAGSWNNPGMWDCGTPQAGDTIHIQNGHTVTLDAPLPAVTITVESGGILDTSGSFDLGGSTVTVNGTFRLNEGGYVDNGTFTYNAGSTLAFATLSEFGFDGLTHVFWPFGGAPTHVTVGSGGLDLNTANRQIAGTLQTSGPLRDIQNLTVNGVLQLNTGGFVDTSPIYGSGATLNYNSGGSYGRSQEWSTTNPHHVHLSANTTLDLANGDTTTARTMNGNLTIDSGSSFTMGNTNADLTVQGNINNSGNLILSTGTGNLAVGGNWTKAASGTFTHNGSWVTFNGGTTQTLMGVMTGAANRFERIIVTNNSVAVFNNNVGVRTGLQVDSGSTIRPQSTNETFVQEIAAAGSDLTCDGTCEFNDLTIRNIDASGSDGVIDVNGAFTINNATSNFTAPSATATFTIAGDFVNNITTGSTNFNNSSVQFDGGVVQTMSGSGVNNFYDLVVGSGTTLVDGAATAVSTTNSFTNNGTFRRTATIGSTGTLAFGLTNVTLEVNSFTLTPQITIDRIDSDHPGATTAIAANSQRYWVISDDANGTFDVDLIFMDETMTDNTAQRTCRTSDNGASWDCVADADPATTVARRNGVTAFSDWQNCGACGPTAVSLTTLSATPQPAARWIFIILALSFTLATIILRRKNLNP
ncbi:MAG: hypothetical protein H6658_06330 [Ardenticatenaceae bacterium]|nr:hypothetical protein [Ardenticatenaceae bacterium]